MTVGSQWIFMENSNVYLQPGTLLQGGKYRIVREIGSGGFGCTYVARHQIFDKELAIKEFFVKDCCVRENGSCNVAVAIESKRTLVEKMQRKFINEAQALFEIRHNNIVRVTDVFLENNTAYYVMDYIAGLPLSDIIAKRGFLPEDESLQYLRQVAGALQHIHNLNRLHLDVKPQNIMVDKDGNAILIDFGVSKQYDESSHENTSTLMGFTIGYAPIEQMGNDVSNFTPATDIYALGATLYKMLSGVTPPSASILAGGDEPEPLPQGISLPVRNLVDASMQLNRRKRPQSIDDFLAILGEEDSAKPNVRRTAMPLNEETGVFAEPGEETMLNYDMRANLYASELSINSKPAGARAFIDDHEVGFTPLNKLRIEQGEHRVKLYNLGWLSYEKIVEVEAHAKVLNVNLLNYSWVGPFYEGRAAVEIDGKWGFIDRLGHEVIPCTFNSVSHFSGNAAKVERNGKFGFIDMDGYEFISPMYDSAGDFSEEVAAVETNGKWFFIDKNAMIAVAGEYGTAGRMSEGLFYAKRLNWNKSGKYGFYDKDGNEVIPAIYNQAQDFSGGMACVAKSSLWSGLKYGFVDKSGDMVIPFEYDNAGNISEDAVAVKKNGKWGFIDRLGCEIIPCRYDGAGSFYDGLAQIMQGGKRGFIDMMGNEIIPCIYDYAYRFSEGLAAVQLNGEWGYIDIRGNKVC